MVKDKYSAIWVSHTSIRDFLECPRAYFLKNVYRDPQTRHKIKLMSPPLALGTAVHEVIESLSVLSVDNRFKEPLMNKFERSWQKINGKKGGFLNADVEEKYKNRGKDMLKRVTDNPGPLSQLAVKIKMELPYFWLSEEDNLILCGKIDWLQYLPELDGVHIIDFKTSKNEEEEDSLQLPIYHLLVHYCQKRHVHKASYWYLEHSSKLTEKKLPDIAVAKDKVLKIAKQIKLARQLELFKCKHKSGCRACRPMEAIIRGEAELVGINEYKQDVYILESNRENNNSIVL